MWEIALERNRAQYVVRASGAQLWPVNSPARRFAGRLPLLFRTDALRQVAGSASWKLVTVNPRLTVGIDPLAILHGIVFGDGTYYRATHKSGRKPSCHVAGWFAADGHVDPRAPVALLAAVSREHLEWLQRFAPVAGLAVSTAIGLRRSQSTFGPSVWYSLGLSASTLDADFFVSPEKRDRYRPAQFLKQWKVVAVQPTDDLEPEYSLRADAGQCVIEGNILAVCAPTEAHAPGTT